MNSLQIVELYWGAGAQQIKQWLKGGYDGAEDGLLLANVNAMAGTPIRLEALEIPTLKHKLIQSSTHAPVTKDAIAGMNIRQLVDLGIVTDDFEETEPTLVKIATIYEKQLIKPLNTFKVDMTDVYDELCRRFERGSKSDNEFILEIFDVLLMQARSEAIRLGKFNIMLGNEIKAIEELGVVAEMSFLNAWIGEHNERHL